MDRIFDIKTDHLKIIQDILRQNLKGDVRVWVFGSRAISKTRHASDLDLALEGKKKIDLTTMSKLKDAFEESDLPYEIDIVDMSVIESSFRKLIEKNVIQLEYLNSKTSKQSHGY